jgi:hypothetical protein
MHTDVPALLKEIKTWNRNARAELEKLATDAEDSCNYIYYDERHHDLGNEGWEWLGTLVSALEKQ